MGNRGTKRAAPNGDGALMRRAGAAGTRVFIGVFAVVFAGMAVGMVVVPSVPLWRLAAAAVFSAALAIAAGRIAGKALAGSMSEIRRAIRRINEGDLSGLAAGGYARGGAGGVASEMEKLLAGLRETALELSRQDRRIEELSEVKKKMERINLELNHRLIELYIIHEITNAVSSTLELDEVLGKIMETIHSFLKVHDFCILLYNEATDALEVKSHFGVEVEGLSDVRFRPGEGITGKVFETGRARIVEDVHKEDEYKFYHGLRNDVRSFLSVPLVVRGRPIGVLNLHSGETGAFSEEERSLFQWVANQVAMAIDNARLFEMTKTLSVTDPLTGMYNHGYFQEKLSEEVERTRRYHRPMSLLMVDVDHFKRVNDRFGHLHGDDVLRDLARLLRGRLRLVDISARYGGEEFAAILPEATVNEAKIVGERLRRTVEEHDFVLKDLKRTINITISVGVASLGDGSLTKDELINHADHALYLAKTSGRNRVRAATGDRL
ncbi:MAG: sensor domain-containing diguanylate cyclase [bacterium]